MNRFFVFATVQLLVFAVLGSCLWTGAGLALFAFVFWHEDPSINTFREIGPIFLSVVPYTAVYAIGIGLFDFALGWLKIPYRVLICAAVAIGSLDWMFANLAEPTRLAGVSLMAALPAALCSWLCNSFASRKPAPAGLLLAPPASPASPG